MRDLKMEYDKQLLFELTIRSFLGDKADHIGNYVNESKDRKKWYVKVVNKIIKQVNEIETITSHKEQLMHWSENALESLKQKTYDETIFTIYLLRLISTLLGYKGFRPYRIATLAYFQTPSQYITDIISKGGDPLQDYYDKQNAITEKKRLIKQLKEEGMSDYKIGLVMNITEYEVKKIRKNL
jgi:hypothetical protein